MSWLSSIELENLINHYAGLATKQAFIGIFSMDKLPHHLPHLPILLIVNTDSSNLPGKHWKAVYISSDKVGEVFDSLALPIGIYLQRWMNTFTKKWTSSKVIVQNPLSATCGAFTLYFVLNRLNMKSMKECINIFSKNLHANDVVMKTFVNELRK